MIEINKALGVPHCDKWVSLVGITDDDNLSQTMNSPGYDITWRSIKGDSLHVVEVVKW